MANYYEKKVSRRANYECVAKIKEYLASNKWKYDNGYISERIVYIQEDDILKNIYKEKIDKFVSQKTYEFLNTCIKRRYDANKIASEAITQYTVAKIGNNKIHTNSKIVKCKYNYKTPRGAEIEMYVKYCIDERNDILYVIEHLNEPKDF